VANGVSKVSKFAGKAECEHCGSTVNAYKMKRHQESKKCLEAQGHKPTYVKCQGCSKSLLSSYLPQHKCSLVKKKKKEQVVKSESKTQNVVIDNRVDNSVNNSVNIVVNVVNNGVLNITPELIQGIVEHFTRDTLLGGGEALANLTLDQLPDGTIACTDVSRGKLVYTMGGNRCVDVRGKALAATVVGAVTPKANTLRLDAIEEECDNYIGKVATANYRQIKFNKGRYITDFVGHIARSCVPEAPVPIMIECSSPASSTDAKVPG